MLRADTKGSVEFAGTVFPGDRRSQLHDLVVGEEPFQTVEEIVRSATAIEKFIKDRREEWLRIGRFADEFVDADREREPNPKALEYLRKWAEEYRSRND